MLPLNGDGAGSGLIEEEVGRIFVVSQNQARLKKFNLAPEVLLGTSDGSSGVPAGLGRGGPFPDTRVGDSASAQLHPWWKQSADEIAKRPGGALEFRRRFGSPVVVSQ